MTNYEYIKQVNKKRLAELFVKVVPCNLCADREDCEPFLKSNANCIDGVMRGLEAEYDKDLSFL